MILPIIITTMSFAPFTVMEMILASKLYWHKIHREI